jgi:hypothetical protein
MFDIPHENILTMTYFLIIYYLSSFYDSVLQSGDILNFHFFFCEHLTDYMTQNFSVLILIIYSVPYRTGLTWNSLIIPGRLSHFAVHWPLTACAVLGLMTIYSVPHKMGLTWNSLRIPDGLSHFAVHWALTASAVLALTHDSDVPEVHPAVLYVPYEPVPPETGGCISKMKLLLWH